MRAIQLALVACLVVLPFASAQDAVQWVHVRVVDVGSGLCCVVTIPPRDDQDRYHYVIYDAGNFEDQGRTAFAAIRKMVPRGAPIDLMVLSHTDSDHLAAVPSICKDYTVERVIRAGVSRTTNTWRNADRAIREEVRDEECLDIRLSENEFPMGATYRFGDVYVTMVCGFSEPPDDWDIRNTSERRNAGSIVVRLVYRGKSVLFCGDSVGRHIGDPAGTCIATEKFMVDNAVAIPIDSDVIIAPHHGSDNASSTRFIRAVSPWSVIFSAGHKYKRPRAAAAKRYLNNGVALSRIFRTDRGDDEGESEWDHERQEGHKDQPGDHDVDIRIKNTGELEVRYR